MLKKSKKGQILKKINVDDAFKSGNVFYMPVEIDKTSAQIFNAESIVVCYLPKIFFKSKNINQLSDFEKNENLRFSREDKPLYINSSQGNKNTFDINNIQSTSSDNNAFKAIYSKNILSSFGQQSFIEDLTPIDFIYSNVEDNVTVVSRTSIEKIRANTTHSSISSDPFGFILGDQSTLVNTDMIVKVYALNNKREVIDNIQVETKPLLEYEQSLNQENIDILLIESNLRFFADTFLLSINPYVFPIRENIENNISIRGVFLDYDISLLNDIFDNNDTLENFNESIRDIRITLSCDDINKSFFVENFNARNLSNFQLRLNQDLYSKSILENTSYKEFIINALNYIKENNLENISVTYSFNLSFNSRDIVVEKSSILTKELIKIAYEDIFKYKLEKNINTGDVINIQFSRYNNILFRGLFNNTYKIKINANITNYLEDDLFQNSISFIFYDYNDNIVNNIDEFYFDENLTENNKITSNIIPLNTLFTGENTKSIYFRKETNLLSPRYLSKCELLFHQDNLTPISVGIFRINTLLFSQNRISENIFDECAIKLGRNLQSQIERRTLYDIFVNRSTPNELFSLSLNRIINDVSFKNLNYFNNNSFETSSDRVQSILNNTIVKIIKEIKINNLEVNRKSMYCLLNEISTIENDKISINTSDLDIMSFEIENVLSNNSIIFENYNHVINNNFNLVDSEFNVQYGIALDFVVLENNTANKFGLTTDNLSSRTNLIDFIIANNQNFQMSEIVPFLDRIYSQEYLSSKQEILSLIYTHSNVQNTIDFATEISIDIDDFRSIYNELLILSIPQLRRNINIGNQLLDQTNTFSDNIFTSNVSKIKDFTFNNVESTRCNMYLDYEHNKFILNKTSNFLFKLSGQKIANILESFTNYARSSISRAFMEIEYQYSNTNFENIDLNSLETSGLELISDNSDDNFIYLLSKERTDKMPLSISFGSNSINIDILREDEYFEKYSNEEYYNTAASFLGESIRSNLNRSRQKGLIIKNIAARVCIVLNINNKNNILLSTSIIKPTRKLINYINRHAVVSQEKYLNLDLINQELEIYKPSVVYKGKIR